MNRCWGLLVVAAVAAGCSTPYAPPVLVHGGSKFPGVIGLLEPSPGGPLDVVLVHGMCTHDETWADAAIGNLTKALDRNAQVVQAGQTPENLRTDGVRVLRRTLPVAGGTINFSALVWSPLTTLLKRQLDYDRTGMATDCSEPGQCKPRRAGLNGVLKDKLLNDCLSDAMAYQGQSRINMRARMIEALSDVVEASASAASAGGLAPGPLVIVSESLGSKLTFDALEEMVSGSKATQRSRQAANQVLNRLALVFMGANQLPILGLADQDTATATTAAQRSMRAPAEDSLQWLLNRKSASRAIASEAAPSAPAMTLVAYTDPNDLLSYRLQPSRYNVPGIAVADVLVSNAPTYLGWLERPDRAHTGYGFNKAVATLIACGNPKHERCK